MGRFNAIALRVARLARSEVRITRMIGLTFCVLIVLIAAVVLGFNHATKTVNRLDRENERMLVANYVVRQIAASVAQLLDLPGSEVGVSFKTSEGLAPAHVQTRVTVLLGRTEE